MELMKFRSTFEKRPATDVVPVLRDASTFLSQQIPLYDTGPRIFNRRVMVPLGEISAPDVPRSIKSHELSNANEPHGEPFVTH